ncbi:MAG: hypothetical protein WDA09_07365, partial [Bacteriovoracaceae bacterium]
MLPRFSLSQYSKSILGMALWGSCLFSFAQTPPLQTPEKTDYPGMIETFEKIIGVDQTKLSRKIETLLKEQKPFNEKVAQNIRMDTDFLNSVILHSNPGYIKLASGDKCRFYSTLITDLLRTAEGKVKNILISYTDAEDKLYSAVLNKRDFLNKVVLNECPTIAKHLSDFEIKNLDKTIEKILFEVPSSKDHCANIHLGWQVNPQTPFLCQIRDYIEEAKRGEGDPKDLTQRRQLSRVLDGKFNIVQKDYLENLCKNLDEKELFCGEFLNVSFWNKIASGLTNKIYLDEICKNALGTQTLSNLQYKECLSRLKRENDLCLYNPDISEGLTPHMQCDYLSLALNHSRLRSDYADCPGLSANQIFNNTSRLLLEFSGDKIKNHIGQCSVIPTAETLLFNQSADNDEAWKLEACYFDKIKERDVCQKTFFGNYANHPYSYTNIVAQALINTRGAAQRTTCSMVDESTYNPLLLEYKSGCHIIYNQENCTPTNCPNKIVFNDRPFDLMKIKGGVEFEYYPLSLRSERTAQTYLFEHNLKKKPINILNTTMVKSYFKRAKNPLLHGIGCAENLLPTFFRTQSLRQCSPLPFIIDGMIEDKDRFSFTIRTAIDSLQAPRIMSWSQVYSGVKSYQESHPLKIWTLH